MKWHHAVLTKIKENQEKKVALAIDTSTNETKTSLIQNIIQLFKEVKPDTLLVQADYKLRDVSPINEATLKWYTHGKSSYTDVLEWAEKEQIDVLFYITDVTGYFYENLEVGYQVVWLVPDTYVPKVPFGRTIKVS
ncbi:VWA-like domain-containing protein [Pullulanibacillus sp. KACC 23026]|uniref:VWA-like domain-containing protein n=1 Tax=Pullulanibacillus sp. KACC 23026 TaxID=3028315 RepID=UPI0023AEB73F|nr:VWA-like domain-containing protein [Pullulanibacillus sp. KACC 23026]WEG14368.1 VWA-like domain-containing protein [Pullulanibacillus sp. KACC 23026]